MPLPSPFVGRTRELRRLQQLLEDGRSVVVTGSYGSGRTSLVRRLETKLRRAYKFLFIGPSDTRVTLRDAVAYVLGGGRSGRTSIVRRPLCVVVFDDVVRVTPQRAKVIRRLLKDDRVRIILIAERVLAGDELVRVRGILNAAPVVHVGPLSEADVQHYVATLVNAAGRPWSSSDLRGIARSTNGYALGMRLTVEAALRGHTADPRT